MKSIPSKDEFLSRYVAEYTDGSFMFLYLRVPEEERSSTRCGWSHVVGVTAYADFQEWDTEDSFQNPSSNMCFRHFLEHLDIGPRDALTEFTGGRREKPYLQVLSEDHRLGRYVAIAEGWLRLWSEGDAPLRDRTVGRA